MTRTRLETRSNRRHWQYSLFALFVLITISAIILGIGKSVTTFPLEALIVGGILIGSAVAVLLYVGELVVIGWIVDFPVWLAERALPAAHVPLEWQHMGEITVVRLNDNIASPRECRSVKEQLDRLIAAGHCDLILDFSSVKKLASGFREVLMHVARSARRESARQNKSGRDMETSRDEAFRIYEDRNRALEEMRQHAGHGWLVLCAVPVGIRAVYG